MTIETIKESYLNWIQENTTFTKVLNESIEISSPFIDSLNENIKIYIEPDSSRFKISDDGYTLWSLDSSGMSFRKGSHRESILYNTIDRFSVSLNSTTQEIYVYSDQKEIGKMIHLFIQAVLSISDMLRLNKNTVKNLFFEEVNAYFLKNQDIYDQFPDFEIQGKSKLLHRFDYLMTVQNKQKKLVRLINNLNQVQLERTLLSWEDTSKQRASKYQENLGMVALINDSQKDISGKYQEAFIQYGIEPVGFSNKDQVKKSLSLVG
jgi:hypothetical protein